MNLHAILSWYDESPTWLAGCIASLTRFGVDHLIAVDGRYPHFQMGAPTNSRADQVDAITSTAMGAGMALTLHRIAAPMLEQHKRSLAFRLLNASATPQDDWVFIIDADETIDAASGNLKAELAKLEEPFHAAACRIRSAVDPFAEPGPDNDVNDKTAEMHQKIPIPADFGSVQSRMFRVLHNMRCANNHYGYQGQDAAGDWWHLRPDIGKTPDGYRVTDIARLDDHATIRHRKNHRTFERRTLKKAYYDLRNTTGLETAV